MKTRIFLAYFDVLGFETIIDCTAYERDIIWSSLKGSDPTVKIPFNQILMRAKANPQRFPEIWTFQSDIDLDVLTAYSIEQPQDLANLIREHGNEVYVTPKQKEVIR